VPITTITFGMLSIAILQTNSGQQGRTGMGSERLAGT